MASVLLHLAVLAVHRPSPLSPETLRAAYEVSNLLWTGALLHNKEHGAYTCGGCGAELFRSDAKFDSGSGWPSFTEPVNAANVTLIEDDTHGMRRVEVRCRRCGSHLGHVFDDGPGPTGQRYCINSLALGFDKAATERKP